MKLLSSSLSVQGLQAVSSDDRSIHNTLPLCIATAHASPGTPFVAAGTSHERAGDPPSDCPGRHGGKSGLKERHFRDLPQHII